MGKSKSSCDILSFRELGPFKLVLHKEIREDDPCVISSKNQ